MKNSFYILLVILLLTSTSAFPQIEVYADSTTINYAEGDIHIQQYLFGSVDYNNLIKQIDRQKRYISRIPDTLISERINEIQILRDLENQLEKFKNDVFRLYQTFTKIEINSERLHLAKAMFEKGEFSKADSILDADEMSKDLSKLKDREKQLEIQTNETEESLERIANEFLIKAQLWEIFYSEPDWFSRAIEYYEKALDAFRSEENVFYYAFFLQKHSQINEAILLYEEILYKYRKLAEINPQTYLPDVATTLNNLAVLQRAKN